MDDQVDPSYFLDNYGTCKLEPCMCKDQHRPRFGGAWVGRRCPDWVPDGSTTFEQLIEKARVKRAAKI